MDVINGLINPETLPGKGEGMKRMMRIVLLALLLTGCCNAEPKNAEAEIGSQSTDTSWTPVIRRRLPIRE